VLALDVLQENLGHEHDLAMLKARLERSPEALGGAEPVARLLRLIASQQQRLRKIALKQGRRLFAARPGEFVADRHHDWTAWRRG
jgi:ATP phosphoribosyltransferase regulatory subunit HisZ